MGARPIGMPLVAANWKMNPTNIDDALDLVRGVMSVARGQADKVEVAIFPPFPWLMGVSDLLVESGVKLGAQDTFWEMSGAFTGEVSPAMLKTLCQWVIVGHSERRLYVGETDEMVAKKTAAALSSELSVIMCVGELLDHYDEGKSDEIVSGQVRAGLASCSADDSARLVIAYEPVWAIGTGRTASPAQAQEVHALLRSIVAARDARIGAELRILYGGSVKGSNAQSLFAMPDIDGGLVGGASLDAADFVAICSAASGTNR